MKQTKRKTKTLNPRQELFCRLFASDVLCIGNAGKAYMEAYELMPEQCASAVKSASRLLTSVDIRNRVNELLDEHLENRVVDRELAKVIIQHENLPAKVAAIREYNRLRDRTSDHLEGEFIVKWEDE